MAREFDKRRAIKTAAIFLCGLFLALDANYHTNWRRMGLISTNPTSRNVEYTLGVCVMALSDWLAGVGVEDDDDEPKNVTPN